MRKRHGSGTLVVLTLFAMLAFAANSVFARLALERPDIDAAGFTAVRLASGALMLLLILSARGRPQAALRGGSWFSAGMLFTYAAAFSFAYLSLDTGTGALILFATVQITMIAAALLAGERPGRLEWLGLAAAIGGLTYLVAPGLEAPSPLGVVLMGLAGIAWGVYSLRGRGSADPVADTAGNFLRGVPPALLLAGIFASRLNLSGEGVLWAVASGALASAMGYAVWYSALPHLSATRAATVQLSVPVIAAAGGVLFLAEAITLRLVVASLLILGGIGLAVAGRSK